jgi:archaellum component FlaG (FlaF/FlaG flagellin family)
MSCYDMLSYVMLSHLMSSYVMYCNAMLCHAMECTAMLYYVIHIQLQFKKQIKKQQSRGIENLYHVINTLLSIPTLLETQSNFIFFITILKLNYRPVDRKFIY